MIRANKRLGQNFLRDEKILQKIVDFAQIEKGDVVLEVGPGEGTLTKLLLEKAGKVIAVEKDEKLAEILQTKFAEEIKDQRLKIITGDILNYELRVKNYALVGNIPYYITGEIFRKFLESDNQPKSLTFVVQKEVAQRIMAHDNKESILSLSVKAYGKPEYGGLIKAGSFNPRPKVDSAIIAVRNISKKRFKDVSPPNLTGSVHSLALEDSSSMSLAKLQVFASHPLKLRGERKIERSEKNFFLPEKRFFEIIKKGFAHKRKLLAKNLEINPEVLSQIGIDPKARAEDLKLDDWFRLVRHPQKN